MRRRGWLGLLAAVALASDKVAVVDTLHAEVLVGVLESVDEEMTVVISLASLLPLDV